jgi:hypothetical protein
MKQSHRTIDYEWLIRLTGDGLADVDKIITF